MYVLTQKFCDFEKEIMSNPILSESFKTNFAIQLHEIAEEAAQQNSEKIENYISKAKEQLNER